MRWKMAWLVSAALTITLSPGSVSTMSDVLQAASVASSIAIPMSAFFSAGPLPLNSLSIPRVCCIETSFDFFTFSLSDVQEYFQQKYNT